MLDENRFLDTFRGHNIRPIIRSYSVAPNVFLYFYTQPLIYKACKINNATGASTKSNKVRDVSKGRGSPGERPYDVSVDKIDI